MSRELDVYIETERIGRLFENSGISVICPWPTCMTNCPSEWQEDRGTGKSSRQRREGG
jgi:hypothetical protein